MCIGLSACVSSHDQQTLALLIDAMGPAEQQVLPQPERLSGDRLRVQSSRSDLGRQACGD